MNDKKTRSPKEVELEQHMALAIGGDKAAYDKVLRALSTHLQNTIGRKVLASDRDDLVQEILVSIHKARHTYDCKRPLMPWVMAIAFYRLQDYWRRHYGRAASATDDIADMENYLSQDLTKSMDTREDIRRVMKNLPAQQQRVLDLMYRQDKSVQEVAGLLNMSVSAVKVAAHRSYKTFRKHMQD